MKKNKFKLAGHPKRFVNTVIWEFTWAKANEENKFIILLSFFKIKMKIVVVGWHDCLKNGNSPKQFIKKFDELIDYTFDVRIKWLTKKVKNLFRVKDKYMHQSCKFYKGVYSRSQSCIGKTVENVEILWNKLNNPIKKSNQSNHVKDNVYHVFN